MAARPGTLDTTYAPQLDGEVRAIVALPDGKALIGGSFKRVNGMSRSGIARLNLDGSVDNSFNPGKGIVGSTDASITAICTLKNGKIMIGGIFSSVDGINRVNIARLNSDGSIDSSFFASSFSTNRAVKCFAIQRDGKLLVGTQIIGNNYNVNDRCLLRLKDNGDIEMSFQEFGGWYHGFGWSNPSVDTILIQGNDNIVIQGNFFTIRVPQVPGTFVYHMGLARFTMDGVLDSNFVAGPSMPIMNANSYPASTTLAMEAATFLVGGFFNSIQGAPQAKLARIDRNGKLDLSFKPTFDLNGYAYNWTADNRINFILVQKNKNILVGGRISTVNNKPRSNLVQLTVNGDLDQEFDPSAGTTGMINIAAEQPDGKLLLGGSFSTMNGTNRAYLARLNQYDTAPHAPIIVQQSIGETLWKGSNTRLFIIQEGIDPQYQWSLNNVSIANATNYFLDLTNISMEMAGEYSVTVSNPFGSVTSAPVRLTIIDPFGEALNNSSVFWRPSEGYTDYRNKVFHETSVGTGWLIEPNDAHDSIKCIRTVPVTLISTDDMQFSTQSRLQTTVIGPGTVSFWWKAIHEYPLDTIDAFTFSISEGDSIILTSSNLFGTQGTGWINVVLRVPEGHRVLTWHTIDGSSQTSFLDQVTYIPDPRFSLESISLSNENGFQFHLESAEGKVFQIERSDDLLQWQPFTCITNQAGKYLIKDGNALQRNRSFYRAIIK